MAESSPTLSPEFLFPRGWSQRLWFLWVTAILPAIAFTLSMQGLQLVDWKNPALNTWPHLLIDRPGSLGFLPLAIPVMATCLAIGLHPGSWIQAFPVRVVLGVGTLLALQYSSLNLAVILLEHEMALWQGIIEVVLALAGITILSLTVTLAGRWIFSRLGARRLYTVLVIGLCSWSVAIGWQLMESGRETTLLKTLVLPPLVPLYAFGILSLVVGPVWSLQTLVRLQLRLGQGWPTNTRQNAFAAAGIGGYLLAWRIALIEAAKAYEKLPDQPPDCFVATAAAHSPDWIAKGTEVRTARGESFRVTTQLQRFKLLELLLKTVAPNVHHTFRRLYDAIGPSLARPIHSPFRAACAWLLLKPAEWLTLALICLVGGKTSARQSRRLYGLGSDKETSRKLVLQDVELPGAQGRNP